MHRYQTNLRPRRTLKAGEPTATVRVKFPSSHPHYKSTSTKSTNDGYNTYSHYEISDDDDSDGSISNFQRVFCCLELCVPWPTSSTNRTNRKTLHTTEEESESQTLPPSPTPTDEENDDEDDEIIRTPLMKKIDSPTSTVDYVNEEEVSKSSSNKDDSLVSNLTAKFDKVHDENNVHPKQNQRLRNRIRKSEDRDFEVQLGIIRSPFITHTTSTSNDNEEEEETDGEGINGKFNGGEEEEVLSFNYTNFSDERSGDNDGYSTSRADSFTTTNSNSSDVGLVPNGTTTPYVQLPLNFPPSSDLTTMQEIEAGNHIDFDNDDSSSSSTVSSNLSFDADDFGEDDVFGSSRYTCTLDGPSFDGSLVASTLLGLSPISEEGSDDEDSADEDSITVTGTSISLGK